MIKLGNNKIVAMYLNGYNILSVYTLGQKMWPDEIIIKILSCYYSGYWIDDCPWTDNTSWID